MFKKLFIASLAIFSIFSNLKVDAAEFFQYIYRQQQVDPIQGLTLLASKNFQESLTPGFIENLAVAVNIFLDPEAQFDNGNESTRVADLKNEIENFINQKYSNTPISRNLPAQVGNMLYAYFGESQTMNCTVRQVFPAYAAQFVKDAFKYYLNEANANRNVNVVPKSIFKENMTNDEINLCVPDNRMNELNKFLANRKETGLNYVGRLARLDAFLYYNERYPNSSLISEFVAGVLTDVILSKIIINEKGVPTQFISLEYFSEIVVKFFEGYEISVPLAHLYNIFSPLANACLQKLATSDFFFDTAVMALFPIKDTRTTKDDLVDVFNKGLNGEEATPEQLEEFSDFTRFLQ